MKKSIVTIIQNTLPDLFNLMNKHKKKSLYFDYDKKGDVIYLSFNKKKEADNTEIYSEDVLLRKKNDDLIGVTILHASEYLKLN